MSIAKKRLRFLSPKQRNPKAPLFVFLPGMDGTGHLFSQQLPGLKALFDIRCLSIPPDDLTCWQGLIEQVANLIALEQKQAAARPIYLCGESFGGCLALQLAAYFPQWCDHLILVNPASSFNRQPWMSWGATAAQWLPDSLYKLSTWGLLPFLIVPERVSRSTCRSLLRAMQFVTPTTAAWRLSLLREFAIEELPLRNIEQSVLVIAGAADRLLPSGAEAERLVKYLPQAKKTILPNSGHACLLEQDIKLVEILRSQRFLLPNLKVNKNAPYLHPHC